MTYSKMKYRIFAQYYIVVKLMNGFISPKQLFYAIICRNSALQLRLQEKYFFSARKHIMISPRIFRFFRVGILASTRGNSGNTALHIF